MRADFDSTKMTEISQSQSMNESHASGGSISERSEGNRLKVLRDVVDNTLKSFTRKLKLIKPLQNVDTNILRDLQKETIAQMEKNVKCEFEQMCEEENIENLLNNLDLIVETQSIGATGNSKGWRSCGEISADLRAHTVTMKQEKLKALQKMLTDLEGQNKLLRNRAQKKEHHLIQTANEIKQIVDHISEITETEKTAVGSLN